MNPCCNWDAPSSQAGWLSHFLNTSLLHQWLWGRSGLHKLLPLPLQKAAGLMFPFPSVHWVGGQEGGGPLWKKRMYLNREHPLVNAAPSQSPRWHWSCTEPRDAHGAAAGAVPIASLTSRGSKPTPAAGAELELGKEMIHSYLCSEALKAAPLS